MNSIERKLMDNTLEYNEMLKKLNYYLQLLEIKAFNGKIVDNQSDIEKLDYYIWKNASQKFPDKYNLCLCKCLDENTTLVYKLLVYKVFQARWCDIDGVAYEGKVIEYAELPKL